MKHRQKYFWFLILMLPGLAVVSLATGTIDLSPAQIWRGLSAATEHPFEALVIQEIRLPRTLLAMVIGASLGLSGAVLQAYLRNPLAEPGLLGVSNGAALGAVIALYGGLASASSFGLPIAAMIGALAAVWLTYQLSGKTGRTITLILAGIAVSSLFGAAVAVVLNIAPNPFAAMEVIFWLMGSLADRTMEQLLLILVPSCVGWMLLISCAPALAALALGDRTARSMGISMAALQWRLALGIALSVGAGVAVAGSIGFIGLMVPHILRRFVGNTPRILLPASAVGGALLLLASDIAVRVIPTSGMELRLGVMTALLGAPFFILLLLKARRGGVFDE